MGDGPIYKMAKVSDDDKHGQTPGPTIGSHKRSHIEEFAGAMEHLRGQVDRLTSAIDHMYQGSTIPRQKPEEESYGSIHGVLTRGPVTISAQADRLSDQISRLIDNF